MLASLNPADHLVALNYAKSLRTCSTFPQTVHPTPGPGHLYSRSASPQVRPISTFSTLESGESWMLPSYNGFSETKLLMMKLRGYGSKN